MGEAKRKTESAAHQPKPDPASSAVVAGLLVGKAQYTDETKETRATETLESLRAERDAALNKYNETAQALHDQMNTSAVLETTVRGLTKLVGFPQLIPPIGPGVLATIPKAPVSGEPTT